VKIDEFDNFLYDLEEIIEEIWWLPPDIYADQLRRVTIGQVHKEGLTRQSLIT